MIELRNCSGVRRLRGTVTGVICLLFLATSLHADGASAPNRDRKADRLIAIGGGGGGGTIHGYTGVIIPLSGDIDGEGYIVRGWAKIFNFDYRTTIAGIAGTKVDAIGYSVVGEFGYQWSFAGRDRIALYGGIRYRDVTLSPGDPGSDLEDGEVGASATLDGRWRIAGQFAVLANASFTAGFDEYWLQLKPHIVLAGGIRLGPDLVVQGGDNYRYLRFGAFVSDLTVRLPSFGRFFLSIEAGLQHDDLEGDDDLYGGIHSAFFF